MKWTRRWKPLRTTCISVPRCGRVGWLGRSFYWVDRSDTERLHVQWPLVADLQRPDGKRGCSQPPASSSDETLVFDPASLEIDTAVLVLKFLKHVAHLWPPKLGPRLPVKCMYRLRGVVVVIDVKIPLLRRKLLDKLHAAPVGRFSCIHRAYVDPAPKADRC